MASLHELRELAKRRHDAASAKVRRLKSQGVEVADTRYDPRVDRSRINRYTKKQLEAYVNRIDSFTDRSTQFVPGRRGVPIPREAWESFERAQIASNIRAEKYLKPHADRVLPTTNVSVRQRLMDRDAMEFNTLRMGRGVSNIPFSVNAQTSRDFDNVKQVKAVERAFRKNLRPQKLNRQLRGYRKTASTMLDALGKDDLKTQLMQLNDKEFDLIWNLTGFTDNLKINYENMKTGASYRDSAKMEHDNELEMRELISWVKTQKLS